jgi:hypothetical protein
MQRMDSTQIASNIVDASRLQLLVEAIQRVHRILSEADQERLAESFEPYLKGSAGHYTYRVKGREAVQEHLQQVGAAIHNLLAELQDGYGDDPIYQVLARIFAEHYNLVESGVCPKENQELASGCLQSVDDLEASYRTKGKTHYKGYVANVTETCDPENDLQLITKVQVAPNNVDDSQLLAEALPDLKKRTEVNEMHTDGGYSSEVVDELMAELEIDQVQTAIKGVKPDPDTLGLEDFQWEISDQKKPESVTCPNGIKTQVIAGRSKDRYLAYFSLDDCQGCPFAADCPAKPLKRRSKRALRFSAQQQHVARRRQLSAQARQSSQNLRAAVEATVRSVKHPFRNGKVPVRGQPRMSMMIIASAAMTNVRRICRYLQDKNKPETQKKSQKSLSDNPGFLFFDHTSYFFSVFSAFSTHQPADLAFSN